VPKALEPILRCHRRMRRTSIAAVPVFPISNSLWLAEGDGPRLMGAVLSSLIAPRRHRHMKRCLRYGKPEQKGVSYVR